MARRRPSFHCEDRKGRYHCFGCGVSGDHFRFLTELDGLSFPEAVERIAGMAGVPMPARDERAGSAREAARQPDRRHGNGDRVLPGPAAGGRRRQGPRLSARARAVAGHAADVPPRLCARQPQCAEGVSGRQGRREGRRSRPAGWCATATTSRSPTTGSATASCSRSRIRGAASSPSAAGRCRRMRWPNT